MEISTQYAIDSRGLAAKTYKRSRILSLENTISELPGAIDAETAERELNTHYFAPGVYGRKCFLPAGICVVGKIHLHAHLNIITHGRVKVVTEFGEDILEGPHTFVSEPGTKRAVVALTDAEWITVHHNPDDVTDIRELEDFIIAPDFETFDRLRLESGE